MCMCCTIPQIPFSHFSEIMKNAGIDTIWSALENKEFNKCGTTLSSCTNKLTWGDNGTTFTYYYQFMDVGEVKFWNTDDGDYETYCSHMDVSKKSSHFKQEQTLFRDLRQVS